MAESFFGKVIEHNNWANDQMIQACSALTDEQLDAEPHSATKGNIRQTLTHLVGAQRNYLATLTLPVEARTRPALAFTDLRESARISGEGLLALARQELADPIKDPRLTRDGYSVKPWVLMVQVVNHATEHREQISSMLTALGITPPDLDGWSFGAATGALVSTNK
jgi:uncharacterized damage-inducible protein DinB